MEAHLFVVFIVNANFVFFFIGIILEGERTISALKRFGIHVDHDVTI